MHSWWALSLLATKVVGHMKDWWYTSSQWVQGSKVSIALLREGLGINIPQPVEVDLVTVHMYSVDNADHICIGTIRTDALSPYIHMARWITLLISPFLLIDNAINTGLPDMESPDQYGSHSLFYGN